jgi:hypothetical protein
VCRIHNVRMIFPFRIVYNPFNFSVLAFSNQLILSFFFLFLGWQLEPEQEEREEQRR